jgi:hypothetical protein
VSACGGSGGGSGGDGEATYTVTTFAGSGTDGLVNDKGEAASFSTMRHITTDGTSLYVADEYNYSIRKIVISSAEVTTLAGNGTQGYVNATGSAARFYGPWGIAYDGTDFFVAENWYYDGKIGNHIRKVTTAGVVTTFAGDGTQGGTDGTGLAAMFNYPFGLVSDGTYLYVSEWLGMDIRRITLADQTVTRIAGAYTNSDFLDNTTGTAARFSYPAGMCMIGSFIYICDSSNYRIRRMSTTAPYPVDTIAGDGTYACVDGTGTLAQFRWPRSITTDGTDLYLTDEDAHVVRKIVVATGVVTTIAGEIDTSGDVEGIGSDARFDNPCGIVYTGGALYVVDSGNFKIKKISI